MFLWKKEFELGIQSIDQQHKELLEIGNHIGELLAEYNDNVDKYDEIIRVMGDLKDYTLYHFKTEEDLFIKHNYADYAQHKKEHDGFITYLGAVNFNDIDQNQKVFLKDLLSKIINWVFKHIMNTDYLYKDYLKGMGVQ